MKLRPVVVVVAVCSLVAVACGSGDEATSTSDVVTRVTGVTAAPTTSTTEPLFAPADSVPDGDQSDDTGVDESSPDEPADPEPTSTDVAVDTSAAPIETAPPESGPPRTDASTSTTEPSGAAGFTLATDGLGSASFGADPDGTISFVSSFYGEPTADTGWVDPFTIGDGSCGGAGQRQVEWDDLRLEFGDVSDIRQDRRHFFAYSYGEEGSLGEVVPAGLATPLGITAGSTVGQLIEAYPSTDLRVGDDFIAPNFAVNVNLTGRMSGLADDDIVELVIGGVSCAG